MKNQLESNLKLHLNKNLPGNKMMEAYLHSVLPAGKLFRPLLAAASYEDHWGDSQSKLEDPNSDLSLFCSAIEIHHAYTLVHDDLPCMDDDDFRRGRESTHKKYGEWQGLLCGDGLLSISLQLIQPLNFETRRFFSWATGPRGLIFGQYLDLSGEANDSLNNLLTIHKLKTARLIQASILGGFLLNCDKFENEEFIKSKTLFKLGHALGITFQIIDDLTELSEKDIGEHEKEINPWIHRQEKAMNELLLQLKQIKNLDKNSHLYAVIKTYLEKMDHKIKSSEEIINTHLSNPLKSFDLV